ncbi:MAG TPA: APC family permease [Candidatus Copromorpha excrementigallinarum]|uniref:APC family permease n=1 Tax=Candidatus Allocopromorpha excrementigallinarum TaxID=2840742 RepID=A0A9D1L6M1_9FIRM|nr:APC family permease [Candidatus Copromorpha excrementigallinarum]
MGNENNNLERASLAKTLGRGDIWAFAFGSIVGWGWIMLAGGWVTSAGTVGAIIAFAIAIVFCCIIGMAFAELSPMLPQAGGVLIYAYRAGGYKFGWFAAWAMCFAYVAVAAWEGPAFGTAVEYLIPMPDTGALYSIQGYDVELPWLLISIAGTLFTVICNWRGMKTMAVFNTIACIALVAGGLIYFGGGVTLGEIANAMPAIKDGWSGIIVVLMAAPAMFVGFDVIPQSVEEMKIPLKQVGKMVIFAIILGGIWYMMMILGSAFGAPAEFRDNAAIPVADIATYCMGSKVFGSIVIIAGIGGILTSWNAMYVGATRIIFSMARAKMLPPVFGKLHPKYKSPTAALTLVGVLGIAAVFLGSNALGWFVDASSFGTVVAYLCAAVAFFVLKFKEPELERPFRAPLGKFMGVLAILAGIAFVCMYLPFSPSGGLGYMEWIMVAIWTVIGIILAVAVRFSDYSKISAAEREVLIYGETYARKDLK